MIGNVQEWCQDWSARYRHPARADDGLRLVPEAAATQRVFRGGSYIRYEVTARAAARLRSEPGHRNLAVGVRAARPLR